MTCIVALLDAPTKSIYMGGDAAAVGGHYIDIRKDSKVFIKENFIYGFTTSFRMGDILQYSFVEPLHDPKEPVERYMRTTYIDSLRQHFKDKGFLSLSKDNIESGGTFLIGYQGRLFVVESDFQVGENVGLYDAVGSGAPVAKGSLFATENLVMLPEKKVLIALQAAEKHIISVKGPFDIKKLNF